MSELLEKLDRVLRLIDEGDRPPVLDIDIACSLRTLEDLQ